MNRSRIAANLFISVELHNIEEIVDERAERLKCNPGLNFDQLRDRASKYGSIDFHWVNSRGLSTSKQLRVRKMQYSHSQIPKTSRKGVK